MFGQSEPANVAGVVEVAGWVAGCVLGGAECHLVDRGEMVADAGDLNGGKDRAVAVTAEALVGPDRGVRAVVAEHGRVLGGCGQIGCGQDVVGVGEAGSCVCRLAGQVEEAEAGGGCVDEFHEGLKSEAMGDDQTRHHHRGRRRLGGPVV